MRDASPSDRVVKALEEQPVNVLDANTNPKKLLNNFEPRLVQDPEKNNFWLKTLPIDPSYIEIRSTTPEDLKARDLEAADASSEGLHEGRKCKHGGHVCKQNLRGHHGGRVNANNPSEQSSSSELQHHHSKRSSTKKGFESFTCSDPHTSDAWHCQSKNLEPREYSYKGFTVPFSPDRTVSAELKPVLDEARARLDKDLKQNHKNEQMKKAAAIIGLVVLCLVCVALLTWLAVFLRRRSKRKAAERAEGFVVELQNVGGDARGEQAGKVTPV